MDNIALGACPQCSKPMKPGTALTLEFTTTEGVDVRDGSWFKMPANLPGHIVSSWSTLHSFKMDAFK